MPLPQANNQLPHPKDANRVIRAIRVNNTKPSTTRRKQKINHVYHVILSENNPAANGDQRTNPFHAASVLPR